MNDDISLATTLLWQFTVLLCALMIRAQGSDDDDDDINPDGEEVTHGQEDDKEETCGQVESV